MTSLSLGRDCDAVALSNSPFMRRGVTLLELLIVLILMGITAALVVPAFVRRAAAPETANVALLASARRLAIRRAEPLRLRLSANGAWMVTGVRNGVVVDSGHVRDSLMATDLLVDALGGCVPLSGNAWPAVFDPLVCASPRVATRP